MPLPGEIGFRAALAMDSDEQSLGNSPGADNRGRLHTKISNTNAEPIPISGTIVIPPGIATSANQTNGAQKTQLVNGAGTVATFTGTAIDVNIASGAISLTIDHTTSNILVYGNDGTNDQKIKTNISGQIEIGNFPSTFGVTQGTSPWVTSATQSGAWTTGRTWVLDSSTDSVNIGNFPSGFAVTQGTNPWVVSGTVTANAGSGTFQVNVTNASLAVTQSGTWTVQQGTPPWSVSQSGAWTTGRTWVLDSSTDSVNVGNFPATQAVTQSTSPWVVSGTVAISGTVAVTQSGAWSVGRTWTLSDSTDSINCIQGTSPWVVSGTVTANQGGTWNINNINNITGTVSLPTGAATSALQTTGNTSLASIDSKTPALVSGRQPVESVGNAASASADSGNPVKTGSVYNATLPTVATGQRVDTQANRFGELAIVSRNLFRNFNAAGTTVVKSGAGRLHTVVLNRQVNSTVTIYDNTAAAGTVIAIINLVNNLTATTLIFDVEFSIGLTVVVTNAPNVTVTYQ